MTWKWPVLFAFTLALIETVGVAQSVSDLNLKRGRGGGTEAEHPAVYIARVISVSAAGRDAFVTCLQHKELPVWQKLKRDGLLADRSVFEMTSVRATEPGVPLWNFLLLSHLVPAVTPDAFLKAEKKSEGKQAIGTRCEDSPGIELRRVEVLHSTPNSYYPNPNPAPATRAPDSPSEFAVEYIVEYIAVKNTASALNEYRETMRLNIGPAMGQLIRDNWFLNLIALETVSVKYSQPGMPSWNQIHVRGYFPDKGPTPAALDGALRQVNPEGGGYAGIFGRLDSIRTLPRDDVARQLSELAVR